MCMVYAVSVNLYNFIGMSQSVGALTNTNFVFMKT